MNDPNEERLEAALTQMLAEAHNKDAATNILAMLFPKAEKLLKTFVSVDTDKDTTKLKRRIAERDFAANYFSLTPEGELWGRSEFEDAVSSRPDEAFRRLQKKVDAASAEEGSDVRRIFLELLDARFSSSASLNQEWLDAILAASPNLLLQPDEDRRAIFSIDNEDRLRWIIVHGFKSLSNSARASMLKAAIIKADDLSLLADIVRSFVGDLVAGGSSGRSKDDLGNEGEAIRTLLLERVKEAAAAGTIWKNARPGHLLWFWWGNSGPDEVKSFTNVAIDSETGIRGLLDVTVSRVRSTAGDYDQVQKSWEEIVDLEALESRAKQLIGSSENEADVRLASRFLDALQRGRNGRF
ncbi:hypothetical protein ACWAUC_29060 [Bradyrhizobium guangdongense]